MILVMPFCSIPVSCKNIKPEITKAINKVCSFVVAPNSPIERWAFDNQTHTNTHIHTHTHTLPHTFTYTKSQSVKTTHTLSLKESPNPPQISQETPPSPFCGSAGLLPDSSHV